MNNEKMMFCGVFGTFLAVILSYWTWTTYGIGKAVGIGNFLQSVWWQIINLDAMHEMSRYESIATTPLPVIVLVWLVICVSGLVCLVKALDSKKNREAQK